MSWYTSAGQTTTTVGFGTTIHIRMGPPPKPPCCHVCAGPPERITPDHRYWCCRCLVIDQADALFPLLFDAVAPEQRTQALPRARGRLPPRRRRRRARHAVPQHVQGAILMDTRSGRVYDTSKPEEAFLLDVERELMRKQGLDPDKIIVPLDETEAAACKAIEPKKRAHWLRMTQRRVTKAERKKKRDMAKRSRRANR